MLMAQELFVTAEVDYRLARADAQYDRSGPRRVRRRHGLHLPRPVLRPLHLA